MYDRGMTNRNYWKQIILTSHWCRNRTAAALKKRADDKCIGWQCC